MQQNQTKRTIDFVSKRYWYFLFSALLIIPGIISLMIPPGLRIGIDFASGSSFTLHFQKPVDSAAIHDELSVLSYRDAIVQGVDANTYFIRTRELTQDQRDATGNVSVKGEATLLREALTAKFGDIQTSSFETVSPLVARKVVTAAFLAVVVAAIGILLYITWAFHKIKNSLRYGVAAIITLSHDVMITIGAFSIFGKLINAEVNLMFITGILTVVGFSVHDTIVVFDRIRENVNKGVGGSYEGAVNASIIETMGRSISTSMTLVFTILAILLFGGSTLRDFMLVLLVGVSIGTYSSIFNAAQILVVWEKREYRNFMPWLKSSKKGQPAHTAPTAAGKA
ncbi:MAG: protein translocase subunit SecF [Dehalococcoidia bacterium]|nr:protein translocase subunit SecF [Dehalococcoidia bacterium]